MSVDADKTLLAAIQARVARIEQATRADVVVTVVPRSGSYDDVYLTAGAGLAGVVLGVLLFAPWPVHEAGVLVDGALAYALGYWLCRRFPALVRLLTRETRRRRQVLHSAAAAVYTTHMTETTGRTGLLIHLSALEQDSVVIPDVGVLHLAPADTWKELEQSLDGPLSHKASQEAILKALDHIEEVLARVCPVDPTHPHEVGNTMTVLEC